MRKWFRIFLGVSRPIFLLVVLSLVAFSAAGQEVGRNVGEVRAQPASKTGSEVEEKLKALEDELREQAKRLEEMRALVAEQQRTIQSLQAKETISKTRASDIACVSTLIQTSIQRLVFMVNWRPGQSTTRSRWIRTSAKPLRAILSLSAKRGSTFIRTKGPNFKPGACRKSSRIIRDSCLTTTFASMA